MRSSEAATSSKEKTSPRKTVSQVRLESMAYKKYPGQQQVDLSVRVDIPGNWFQATSVGGLSTAERKEKYAAIAVEYDEAHLFEPEDRKRRKSARIGEAVRFLCPDDAADDSDHAGFWIELDKWNRYRNDTYKDDREAEVRPVCHVLLLAPTLLSWRSALDARLSLSVACPCSALRFRRRHTFFPVSWRKLKL